MALMGAPINFSLIRFFKKRKKSDLISFLVDFSLQLGQEEPEPRSHFSMQLNPKK